MNSRNPKWSKWNLVDDAKVWQVVALSLDINPDGLKRDASDWMTGGSYVNHGGEEFKDRLDVIQANYRKIDTTPKTLSMNGIAYCELNIPKFANWAIANNLAIPDELKQRAMSLELNDTGELDWSKYRCMSLWSEAEFQAILCGLPPDGARPSSSELNDAIEQIRRAILAKELPSISPNDATAGDKLYSRDRFIKPDDAIRWASNKFPKFIFKNDAIQQTEKPLSDKERETLLIIIAALAKEAKVDITKISKTGDLIANMTQLIGAPIGATTIETHLKKINQALVNRTK